MACQSLVCVRLAPCAASDSCYANCRSPRPRAQSDITIVSQLSLDRLEVLGHQCTAWGGVTSAAVYLPLLVEHTPQQQAASLAAARATLTDFHAATEAAGASPTPSCCCMSSCTSCSISLQLLLDCKSTASRRGFVSTRWWFYLPEFIDLRVRVRWWQVGAGWIWCWRRNI